MESQQPRSKRTRTESASSGSGLKENHPAKAAKTETRPADAAQSLERAEDAELSGPSGGEGPQNEEATGSQESPSDGPPSCSNDTPGAAGSKGLEEHPDAPQPTDQEPTKASADEPQPKPDGSNAVVYSNGDWEAVYHPEYVKFAHYGHDDGWIWLSVPSGVNRLARRTNAYYFVNAKTGETTWTNPLVGPEPLAGTSKPTADLLGGIDPELAYLDPQMARLVSGHGAQTEPRIAARFNARTGRFEGDPTRDPSRVSEFARARTQAEAFFDVSGWEKTLEKHNGRVPGTAKESRAAALEQGKKLSKAQLNQFKQQKMEKKARNQRAWLT
ncbi:hypothetical protein PtB15_11B499 [Puccinia triticina]|nr:hypothetical protein PtB15_11B499 [Puccinia triticina]